MNKLIITYDLCGDGKNYDGLIKKIEQYPVHLKINKSSWIVKTPYSCSQVRDELSMQIDHDDMLFVAKLTGVAAWTKAETDNFKIKNALESE